MVVEDFRVRIDSKPLFGMQLTGNVDEAGNCGMMVGLAGSDGEHILSVDNRIDWAKPQDSRWDTAGHYNVSSVLDFPGNVNWNFLTNLDYEQNMYRASMRNIMDDRSEMFHVFGHGTYGDSDPYW